MHWSFFAEHRPDASLGEIHAQAVADDRNPGMMTGKRQLPEDHLRGSQEDGGSSMEGCQTHPSCTEGHLVITVYGQVWRRTNSRSGIQARKAIQTWPFR